MRVWCGGVVVWCDVYVSCAFCAPRALAVVPQEHLSQREADAGKERQERDRERDERQRGVSGDLRASKARSLSLSLSLQKETENLKSKK